MIFVPAATGRITDGIYAISALMVNMFIIKYGNNTICVDTGTGGPIIGRGLKSLKIGPEEVSHIFLTHSDSDHAGGVDIFRNADILMSRQEEQMITGKKCRAFGMTHNKPIKRKYTLLDDDETIKIGDITVKGIGTPGHTPGSMSYLVNDKYLFVGDTLALIANKAHHFPAFINMDTGTQLKSIEKLSALKGVEMMFTAHSGYTRDFDSAMKAWQS